MADVVEALVLGKLLESSFSLLLYGAAPPACREAGLMEVARLGGHTLMSRPPIAAVGLKQFP